MKEHQWFRVAMLLIVFVLLAVPGEAQAVTQADAVDWCKTHAKNRNQLEYNDRNWMYQCVDFISCYADYIGCSTFNGIGSASNLATSSVRTGWERIQGTNNLQPGDVFIDVNGTYGHTGVIVGVSGNVVTVVDQNGKAYNGTDGKPNYNGGGYVAEYNYNKSKIWGVLRPTTLSETMTHGGKDITTLIAGYQYIRIKTLWAEYSGQCVCAENNATIHIGNECSSDSGVYKTTVDNQGRIGFVTTTWDGDRLASTGNWIIVGQDGYLTTTSGGPQLGWESFSIFELGGKHFLYSHNDLVAGGKSFVQGQFNDSGSMKRLKASGTGMEGWEGFLIEPYTPAIESIYIKQPPAKTEYIVGETLNTEGLVVMARWNNRSETDITKDVAFSTRTLGIVGDGQSIQITYRGKTADTPFYVDVTEKPTVFPAPTTLDAESLYASVIQEYRQAVMNARPMDEHFTMTYVFDWEPLSQVALNIFGYEPDAVRHHFGYAFCDLNSDQRPEMILLSTDYSIYAIVSMDSSNKPKYFGMYYPHDGGEMLGYFLNLDNTFVIDSEGPMGDRSITTYQLNAEGNELEFVHAFGIELIWSADTDEEIVYYQRDGAKDTRIAESEYQSLLSAMYASENKHRNFLSFIPLFTEQDTSTDASVSVSEPPSSSSSSRADDKWARTYYALLQDNERGIRLAEQNWWKYFDSPSAYRTVVVADILGDSTHELCFFALDEGSASKYSNPQDVWYEYGYFHIYTFADGNPLLLLRTQSSNEGAANRFFTTTDGALYRYNAWGSGDLASVYAKYRFSDNTLVPQETLGTFQMWESDIEYSLGYPRALPSDLVWPEGERIDRDEYELHEQEILQSAAVSVFEDQFTRLPSEGFPALIAVRYDEAIEALRAQLGDWYPTEKRQPQTIENGAQGNWPSDDSSVSTSGILKNTTQAPPLQSLQIAGVSSPTHPKRIAYTYGPENVLDVSDDTSWQYNANQTDGNGYKTYLTLQLSAPSTVDTLLLKNGFWAITSGVDQYWRNHRVKEASVTFQYADSDSFSDPIYCTFEDEKTMLSIDLGSKKNVVALCFEIKSTYAGNKFDDVAITYMNVLGYPETSASDAGYNRVVAGNASPARADAYQHPTWISPSFPRGKNFPVYSGPGTHYIRSANGKASVSTNEWIHVFGVDGDWVLVEYSINAGTWRRGYIKRTNIPSGVQLPELPNANLAARTIAACAITDDPDNGKATAEILDAGAEVLYLFGDKSWAYVETWTASGLMRGYVQMDNLSF